MVLLYGEAMSTSSPEFIKKFRAAQRRYIRELKEGCVDCMSRGECIKHRREAFDVILRPRKCPEFQAFLKAEGIVP